MLKTFLARAKARRKSQLNTKGKSFVNVFRHHAKKQATHPAFGLLDEISASFLLASMAGVGAGLFSWALYSTLGISVDPLDSSSLTSPISLAALFSLTLLLVIVPIRFMVKETLAPTPVYVGYTPPSFLAEGRNALARIAKLAVSEPLSSDPDALTAVKGAAELYDSLMISYSSWLQTFSARQAEVLEEALTAFSSDALAIVSGTSTFKTSSKLKVRPEHSDALRSLKPLAEQAMVITEVFNALVEVRNERREDERFSKAISTFEEGFPSPAINLEASLRLKEKIGDVKDFSSSHLQARQRLEAKLKGPS